jgi:hypothetical protein
MQLQQQQQQQQQQQAQHQPSVDASTRPYDLINESYMLADESEIHINEAKRNDPPNGFTDALRDMNNAEIFRYMKQCRLSVARLRKCWVALNEEIKACVRVRQYLESAIEHVRKDLIINKGSASLPVCETMKETKRK